MVREHGDAEAASIIDEFAGQMRAIAETTRKRALLTGQGIAADGRVTVTVNSDSAVIATRFSDDIDDLGYDEIAQAVTEAAQKAIAEVTRKAQELMRPLSDKRGKMPKLSELFEGMPDLETTAPPAASMAAPGSRERRELEAEPAPEYTEAVDYEEWDSRHGSRIADR
ncbi:YbaB/EbfC family nucleoid-associated protein [Nocardia jejuensis]|uniref:YbaB/EbfC family nucleoid-associated protein n=1 Tax=Nocardia jejuensis TaxID=328049 RepID=UPI000AB7598A|nr:YbaB/EbfC family nucleoid-associated protein [Nocardia jejuensis]